MKSCSSVLLLLTCLWACEATSPQSIVRHDSTGNQKSIAVDAAGALALDASEEGGFVETDSLHDSGDSVGAHFHGVSVDATTTNKSGYSTQTSFCYEQDSATFGNCWANVPPSNTPACTPSSGSTVCRCPDATCDIDNLASSGTTGRCAEKKIYVAAGLVQVHGVNSDVDVTGTTESVFCENMVMNNQWAQQGCIKTASDDVESYSKKWWQICKSGYTGRWDGKCYRKVRFIEPKESCWDSVWGGKCKNHESSYDEYSTSCFQGQCVPYAFARNREECSCSWLGYPFIVVCSASGGSCGGHACVMNTGDGKHYCDYATEQNWHSILTLIR